MKKLLIYLGAMLMPVMALAVYNDVSLGTSAIISVNDSLGNTINLTVTGTSDVIDTLSVGSTSFNVIVDPSSTLTLASAGRNAFITTADTSTYSSSCTSSQSSVTVSATATSTVSFSVSPNACGDAGSSSSSSSGGNGPIAQSGGGGGGSYIGSAVSATAKDSTTGQAQVDALKATLAGLQAQLDTTVPGKGFAFGKALSVGSRSSDVMNVQKVLNSDTDTQVASSGAGSKGNETTFFGPATLKAIKKFQVKYGLAKPGGAGYGVFGPKTKAKLAEVSKLKGL